MTTLRRGISEIAKKAIKTGLKKGYLAEDYDGVANHVQVLMSRGSASAVQAAISAGSFGTEQVFEAGTPVFVLEYNGHLEVVSLGSKMGAGALTVEMFPTSGVPADTEESPIIAPGTLPGTAVMTGGITGTQISESAIDTPQLAANAVKAINIDAKAVTADKIDTHSITTDQLATELIMVSNKLIASANSDGTGARVEIASSGLKNFDSSEVLQVNVPTDGSGVFVLGDIRASSFIATNGAEIRTTSLFAAGSITSLGNGVANPTSAPVIVSSVPSFTLGTTPPYPGHGICFDPDGSSNGTTDTYIVGADPTTGNLLDMAYEYDATTGTLLRTIRKTGTEQILTDYLGEQTHVSDQATVRQGATYSQIATPLTFPSNRGTCTITAVSVYVAGYSGTCSVRNAVWATDSTLLTQSSAYDAANKAFDNGNSVKYNKAVTAYAVAAGTTVRAGFLRTNTSDYSQWDQDLGSGKTEYRGDGNNGNMTSVETFSSQKPNVYITYTYVANASEEGTTGKIIGVARGGSSIWCLDANGMLFKYNQSDLDYLGKYDLSSYITGTKANAGLFYDSTAAKLIIVTATGVTGTDRVKFIVVEPSTGGVDSTAQDDASTLNGSTATIRGGCRVLDGATATYWLSVNGVIKAFLQSNGDYVSDRDFGLSAECNSGVTKDATKFCGWSSASAPNKIYRYTDWDWTTASSVYWVCYTWYDNVATTHETAVSPRATITLGRRRQLLVSTPTIPTGTGDDPNRVRVYMARGSSDPLGANYDLQSEHGTTSYTATSYNDAGAANPTSNDFPAGSPAEIKSAAAGWSLKGDGTATFRSIAMPAPLAVTNSSVVASSTALTVAQALQSSFLIVQTSTAGSANVSSISQTNVTWTKIRSYGASTSRQEVWKGIPTGTPGTTCTVTWSGSTSNMATYSEWPASAGLTGTIDLTSESTGTQSYAVGGFIVGSAVNALTLVTVGCSNGGIIWGSLPGPYNTLGVCGWSVHGYAWMGGQASYCQIGDITSSNFAGMMITIT